MDRDHVLNALAALAQPTRLDAFRLLVRAGPAGMPAGAIGERLGARQNTMSSHLASLTHAGLVTRERNGRSIRYRADYDGMRAVINYLLLDCCGGVPDVVDPVIERVREGVMQ